MRFVAVLGWGFLLASASIRADVLDALATREGMSGQFTQEIISLDGEVLERAIGNFGLMRPHFLRWEIMEPDRQLLLANGERLTQIDWDLEVTVERQFQKGHNSPLNWLLASRAELDSNFDVSITDDMAVLVPKQLGSAYQRLEIARLPSSVWRLDAEDRGGQVLRIMLHEDIKNLPRAADFVAPQTSF